MFAGVMELTYTLRLLNTYNDMNFAPKPDGFGQANKLKRIFVLKCIL